MNKIAAQRRMKEILDELATRQKSGRITAAYMDKVEAEYAELETVVKAADAAANFAGSGDMHPSRHRSQVTHKGIRWNPPSPLHASESQIKSLFSAARSRMPSYSLEIGAKSAGDWDMGFKSPISEGGIGGGGLPSVILPTAFQLPYEPDRLFSHFNGSEMPGPSVSYVQHTGNTNPAAAVAELGTKPEIGMNLTVKTVSPTKIAALASVSMEALDDYADFARFVPTELTRALLDAETDQILNGNGTAPNMTGILNTSGLLTRAIGSDTRLDAIRKGINDIRVGSSFGVADLIVLHPSTWAQLQLEKSSQGVYLLNPNDPNAIGDLDNVFGVKVIATTKIAAGTALIFDTSQAVTAWTRMGLRTDVNYYGNTEFNTNAVTFRIEERIAIGVQRPTAIAKVTGLGTAGS